MFTESTTSLRRLSAYVLTLLLFCVSFSKGAEAQAATPVVTGSLPTTLTPPTGLGTVVQTALDNYGNWLVMDYANGGLYEYPVGGGPVITIAPATTFGGYANPGITFDSMNNLYVEGNYSNCVLLFPWDAAKNTWDGFTTVNAANPSSSECGLAPYSFAQFNLLTAVGAETQNYIQPWGMAMLPGNVLVAGSQEAPTFIFTLPIIFAPSPASGCQPNGDGDCSPTATPGTDNASAATLVLLTMAARPNSVAADKFGNIYFVEDSTESGHTRLPGAYMIPAGDTQVPSDTSSVIVRVDPMLPNVQGIATDANGNLYISDATEGVFMVPNPSGTPNTAGAVLLTPVPATGQVSVDSTRGILFVPTTNNGLTKVTFNTAQLGSTAAGAPAATSQSVLFGFNGPTGAFPVLQEAGATTPDFTIAPGGTCATQAIDTKNSSCTVNVTLSPHSAGHVSAKLLILNPAKNVIGSINLQGTGTGSAVQVLPGADSVIGAGLKTPSQVAVDAAGNTYVADSGLHAVEMYPKGYGAVAATTTVGTGLTAPTGVAVDGAGDVFIGDSGNVIEVPIGASGLNTAGQVTLKSGLGATLNLAADGLGNLYIADPTDKQVVKLGNIGGSFGLLGPTETDMTAGFNAPSAVAVDASGDLYVADGSNLIEVTPSGTQSTLLSTLNGATGLAVDPSGAVYVAEPGGTLRIPDLSGTLTPASETMVASTVTAPTSVAVDSSENVYITDSTAEDVELVSNSASTNFGMLSSTTATQSSEYTILDAGNSPLNVSGFSSTPDYSETATTCVGTAVAVGSTCTAMVTFNPGPGDQGTLSTEVLVKSDAVNAPVGVNVTGVGAALAPSTTTVSVKNATVDGAPAVITVAPTSGTGTAPTGQVTLTVTGANLTAPVTVTGTLANGTVTLTPLQIPAGTYTYSVSYQGDRVYGTSSATAQVTVGVGAVTLVQAPLTPSDALVELGGVYYVLANGTIGTDQPYDGSIAPFLFTYAVQVVPTNMAPLIGQTVLVNGKAAINYGSVTYQGTTGCATVAVANDGTAPLAFSCLDGNVSNTAIPDLETTYTITPMYSPTGTGAVCPATGSCPTNPNYAPVTGTPITVTALRNPVVQITSSPSSLTVTPGSTVTATLTLTSLFGFGYVGGGDAAASGGLQEPSGALLNNYSLPVQLTCDGLPAYATCTFTYPTPDVSDPNSVAVGPPPGTVIPTVTNPCTASVGCVGPGTVIMTITTNVPTGVIASLHRGPGKVEFAAIFGFGLLGLAFGKKRKLRGLVLTMACLLLSSGIVAGISGCSTQQLGTNSSTVTPASSTPYMVTVTAKQVGSRTITAVPGIVYGNGNQVSLPFTIPVTIQ